MSDTIHFNSSLPLPSTFKSQGQGDCGREGYVSPWPGVVNCKECLKLVEAEKAQSFFMVRAGASFFERRPI